MLYYMWLSHTFPVHLVSTLCHYIVPYFIVWRICLLLFSDCLYASISFPIWFATMNHYKLYYGIVCDCTWSHLFHTIGINRIPPNMKSTLEKHLCNHVNWSHFAVSKCVPPVQISFVLFDMFSVIWKRLPRIWCRFTVLFYAITF